MTQPADRRTVPAERVEGGRADAPLVTPRSRAATSPPSRFHKPSEVSVLLFIRDKGVIVLWLVMMVAFSIWAAPTFGTFDNLMLILQAAAITSIFAAGAAFGVLTGLLDLSLPGTAAVSGIVVAELLLRGTPVALALLAGICVGVVVGSVNAMLTLRGLNSLVVTIGMFSVLAGTASVISSGVPVAVTRLGFIGSATYARVPGPVFVMLGVFVVGTLLITQTRAGTRMMAVGGDPEAASRAGVRTEPYIVIGFVLVSVCAAIGGITTAAFTASATPVPDPTILFNALTAVALSGMPFSGGRGSFPRVVVGALIIATISSVLVIKNIQLYWATVATGVLLIVALGLERIMNRAVSVRLVTQYEGEASGGA